MAFGRVSSKTIRGRVTPIVEWRDPYGKRKQKAFESEDAAAKWLASGQLAQQASLQPTVSVEKAKTLRAYAAHWVADVIPVVLAPKTVRSYTDTLERHILEFRVDGTSIGSMRPVDFRVGHMKALLTAKRLEGYSGDSIRIMWATMSSMLSEAVDDELLSLNPLAVKTKSIRKLIAGTDADEVRKAFTEEQANRFLFAAKASPLYVQFLTGLDAGLRIGEWRGLWLTDLSLSQNSMRVQRKLSETGKIPSGTKGKRARTVDVTNRLRKAFEKIIAARPALVLKRGWPKPPPWVFVTRNGTPYGQRNVQAEFGWVLAKAGLADQGFSAHSLRHTFACLHLTHARNVNVVQWVQQQLGHASIATTMLYAKTIRISDPDAADRLELLVNGSAHENGRENGAN